MDFSETIEVKTIDKTDHYSVDSYFFAYFQDLSGALEQIRDAVRTHRSTSGSPSPPPVLDTTATRAPHSPLLPERTPVHPEPPTRSSSVFRFTSLLRPLQDTLPLLRTTPANAADHGDEYTHISKRAGSSFVPVTTTSPKQMSHPSQLPDVTTPTTMTSTGLSPAPAHHTYPPANSPSASIEMSASPSREGSGWGTHVSSWLRMPSRRLLTSPFGGIVRPHIEHSASMPAGTGAGGVSEVLTTHPSLAASRSSGDYGFFSILEAPESTVDPEMEQKFRDSFAFDEKEKLLGCTFIGCVRSWNSILTFAQVSLDIFSAFFLCTAGYLSPRTSSPSVRASTLR